MDFADQLLNDQLKADRSGVRFEVCTQTGRARPWQSIVKDITSIAEALEIARQQEAWKVAVFAVGDGGGYHYWSSDYPELLNSTVLDFSSDEEDEA